MIHARLLMIQVLKIAFWNISQPKILSWYFSYSCGWKRNLRWLLHFLFQQLVIGMSFIRWKNWKKNDLVVRMETFFTQIKSNIFNLRSIVSDTLLDISETSVSILEVVWDLKISFGEEMYVSIIQLWLIVGNSQITIIQRGSRRGKWD